MKRYDIDAWDSCMCESGEGSYVRYEDHAARLRELEADRYRLAAIVGRCRGLLFTSWREGHMGHRVMSLDLRISPERHGSLMHMLAAEAAEGDQVMTPEETLKADTSVAAEADYKAANAAAGDAFATFDAAREAYVAALDAATAKETDR